ncbi:MAG: 1-acyl-sn-glycerol-3-phosphate acyltransferase, partial [Microcystaceae cyanobacterium]
PLLPISLWGTEKILQKGLPFPRPVPVTIRIGELIAPPNSSQREELQTITDRCTTVIKAMYDLGR